MVLKVLCDGYRLSQLQLLYRPKPDRLQSQVCQKQRHTRFHLTGAAAAFQVHTHLPDELCGCIMFM